MATVEDNKPYVRAMGTFRADDNGIIFSMQSDKDVYRHLKNNHETQLCYFSEGIQIRISGQMEPITDLNSKKEIVEKRPFYKPGVEKNGWDYVGAFKLKNPRATVLDMKAGPPKSGAPKEWIGL